MATIINPPGLPTVQISTLGVGQWCLHPAFPGACLRLLEKRSTDSLFVVFSAGEDAGVAIRANTQLVTPISAPVLIELTF